MTDKLTGKRIAFLVANSGVEQVELAQRSLQTAAIAEENDQGERRDPGDRGVDVDRLDERPATDQLGEAR